MVSGIPFLTSVDAKLAMAEEHLGRLQEDFARIGEQKGNAIFFQHNADSTEVTLWIRFDPPPGVRWGGIIGDHANNLRSALDHMVYAIAVGESGQEPPPEEHRLQFPIADLEKNWKNVKYHIDSLSDPVRALIQGEQPYKRRKGRELVSLSVLGALTNRDKHRTILVGASLPQGAKFDFIGPTQPVGLQKFVRWKEPAIDQAPLVTFVFDRPNPNVDVDVKFSFGVGLNIDGVWCPAMPLLRTIRDEVARLVDLLRPCVK
jgi:hypothetical protein